MQIIKSKVVLCKRLEVPEGQLPVAAKTFLTCGKATTEIRMEVMLLVHLLGDPVSPHFDHC